VDREGIINLEDFSRSLRDDTSLVSIAMGNNEIGVVQDIKELARLAHEKGAVLHTDAVQAFGKIPIDVKDMGIDLLSISGHKIYAPKGVGALYIRKGIKIARVNHGGSHERGLRSGTENVPAIVGFGKAAELAGQRMEEDAAREKKMRDRLIYEILTTVPESYLNGHQEKRLPNNVNIRFSHIEGEAILLNMDYHGIAVTTGSACSSASLDPSHVMLAIGLNHEEAHGSVRLTLGRQTTDEEVERVLEVLPEVIEKLRKMSPLG
ncbi:MAG: aminotransferase class V-fold PLP-dependent enzyme, partial [Thermoplasmata archaeon]|nr:aminotransferase class V-fold PLP-dependent enzyme [Thermoplasmata archaeon]